MTDEHAATEAAATNGAGELDPTAVDANELAKNMSQATRRAARRADVRADARPDPRTRSSAA